MNGWKEKFLVNMSGIDSWGGKDIIIKADNDTNYYKWNGSDFEVTTQPADWN